MCFRILAESGYLFSLDKTRTVYAPFPQEPLHTTAGCSYSRDVAPRNYIVWDLGEASRNQGLGDVTIDFIVFLLPL